MLLSPRLPVRLTHGRSPDSNKPLSLLLLLILIGIARWPFTLPFAVDREEWEEEAQVALGMQEVLQSLRQAAEKLRQASGRLQGQEEEVWLQQRRNQSPQVWNHPRKVSLKADTETWWNEHILLGHHVVLLAHPIFRGR